MSGRHAVDPAESSAPAMPVIRPIEQYQTVPFALVEGPSQMIGWQWKPARKGDPAFVLINRGAQGSVKAAERFLLTQEGWAWHAYVTDNPDAAEKRRGRLKARDREQRELDQRLGQSPEIATLYCRSPTCLLQVGLLCGCAPEAANAIGERYDARFLEDRLGIFTCHHWEPLAEVPCSEVEDVEIIPLE